MTKKVDFTGSSKMVLKSIPEDTMQLFLPLYLKHPAALRLRSNGIHMCGISETTPGFRIHRVPSFMLAIFTTRGHGMMRTNHNKWELNPGSLFLAPVGQKHDYRQTGKENWRFLWFHLKPLSPWLEFNLSNPIFARSHGADYLEKSMDGFAVEIFAAMHSPETNNEEAPFFYQDSNGLKNSLVMFNLIPDSFTQNSTQLAELHANLIQLYLERELHTLMVHSDDSDIRNKFEIMWESINSDLGRGWTLQDMCSMVNMSVSTLIRQIKRCYEASPMQILYHMRLVKAAQLLLNTRLSVSAVSWKVGYENVSSFSTAFKSKYGHSPREYRLKCVDKVIN